jgi:DNA-damage-inducible protein J
MPDVLLLEIGTMATSTISVRFDTDIKKDFEAFCNNVGLNPSAAITLFVKAVLREKRIPFEINEAPDPFYSESNMNELRRRLADGRENWHVHEPVEAEDDEQNCISH